MPTRAKIPTLAALAAICAVVALGVSVAPRPAVAQAFAVEPPARTAPGKEFATPWTGEDAPGDFIALAAPGAAPEKFIDYARTSAGNPATLTAPPAGAYEVRYVSANGLKVRARASLTVASEAELIAPAEAEAGTEITVAAPAGGDAADYVTIVAPDADALALGPYVRLRGAAEVMLAAPEAPGAYEVRLVHAATQTIRARALLTVRAAAQAPAPAAQATTSDEAARRPEAAAPASKTAALTASDPAPVETAAEPEPATPAPRTVRRSLMALIAVDRGAGFHVAFTGAGAPGDEIGIAPAGGGAGDLLATQAAAGGAPLAFDAPAEPGNYDILYVDASGQVLARRELEVW